jgi:dolichol kinase
MGLRLHRGGKFRTWLGARFGGDFALGDRLWRRALHGLGAVALVYYVVPTDFFRIAPKEYVLLAALAFVLALELLRHLAGLELPTIRSYEEDRIGSFAVFAVAIVAAVLLFPLPIACAVVLGTAVVDPLAGELRANPRYRKLDVAVPFLTYSALAFTGLAVLGRWAPLPSVGLALLAGGIAVAVERPKVWWVDDDLVVTLVPAVALYLIAVVGLGLPS